MNLLSNNLRLQILAFLEECCEPREKSIKSSMCALMRATTCVARKYARLFSESKLTILKLDREGLARSSTPASVYAARLFPAGFLSNS